MYSTITKKKCKCSEHCDKWPSMGYSGFYSLHAPQELKDKIGSKNKVAKRNKNNRMALGRKLMHEQDKVDPDKKLMELWFAKIAVEIRQHPYCWECNAWIAPEFYRSASAHIFPKTPNGGFPSVAVHPMNYLILGASCGCHYKTHRLDTFCQMAIWKEAVDRFKEFESLITESHKYLDEFKRLVYGNME